MVKELDLKSNGKFPRRFEPCSRRNLFNFFICWPAGKVILPGKSVASFISAALEEEKTIENTQCHRLPSKAMTLLYLSGASK